ncbi:MAG TPA: class I SAM-dependent methyltransferase [Thermomicrobiales bacterium]|nr:class I SAM-dependent methyltransferase [Thermomicrobiales bacterium]
MSGATPRPKTELTDALHEYLLNVSLREPGVLRQLREETAALPHAGLQVAPEQGQLLGLLARLVGARRTLEVGTFTGYSSLSVALVLPDDGRLIACDVSEEWTAIARRYWAAAGVADKIDLRLGPAVMTLDRLLTDGGADQFDFAFIDADKRNYANYYERALQLVRPGGLIVVDNTLWHGRVLDPALQDADTMAVRAFNEQLHHDDRIALSLVPIGDGMTLALRLH